MKLKEETELTVPQDLKDKGLVGVSLTAKYYEQRGASDFIEIHVHQPEGVEKHRMSKFKVTNKNENECAYVQTRGRSKPWEMAILGLGIYGWTCTNYTPADDRTRKERFEERHGHLQSAVNVFTNVAMDYDDDPMLRQALLEAASFTAISSMLLEYEHENDETFLDAFENEGREILSSVKMPMADEDEKQRILHNLGTLLKAHSDVDEVLEDS